MESQVSLFIFYFLYFIENRFPFYRLSHYGGQGYIIQRWRLAFCRIFEERARHLSNSRQKVNIINFYETILKTKLDKCVTVGTNLVRRAFCLFIMSTIKKAKSPAYEFLNTFSEPLSSTDSVT